MQKFSVQSSKLRARVTVDGNLHLWMTRMHNECIKKGYVSELLNFNSNLDLIEEDVDW